jgi:choline kinase
MAGTKHYKVLIPAASVSRHLGDLVEYTNHSLIRIGKKPTLSYIIESYPKEVSIVIVVGHFGNQIKDFVKITYPDRKFEFVEVDKYEGSGSSLGYSMLKAKDKLQCPFIYHAGDTIVDDKVLAPKHNWIGGFKSDNTANYASLNIVGERVLHIDDKGATNYGYVHNIHIGLVGIKEYQKFWDTLKELYNQDHDNEKLGDMMVINEMLKQESIFYFKPFETWFDVGNIDAINQVRKKIKDPFFILDKLKESIFIFDDFVVKFFYDKKNVEERVFRATLLKDLVPEIEKSFGNFYRYRYTEGSLLSRAITPIEINNFFNWAENKLWKDIEGSDKLSKKEFREICYDFYYNKSLSRIEKMQELSNIEDKEDIINGEKVPSIKEMLKQIDFQWLAGGEYSNFHGDFVLDNILKTKNSYCLLDWRQNFGKLLGGGDKYYDLAKFNHNLVVNHDIINDNLFNIDINELGVVTCDIMRRHNLVICQETFHQWLLDKGFDLQKVKILTALIWLNMSPLHHHPFNLFLYYFGKLNLWKNLKNK